LDVSLDWDVDAEVEVEKTFEMIMVWSANLRLDELRIEAWPYH
jgi:hypothetical protein